MIDLNNFHEFLFLINVVSDYNKSKLILSLIQSLYEKQKIKYIEIKDVLEIANDQELMISSEEINECLQLDCFKLDGSKIKLNDVFFFSNTNNNFDIITDIIFGKNELKPSESISLTELLKTCCQNYTWQVLLVKYCMKEKYHGSPVFWSFDIHKLEPLSPALGSFVSTEIVLMQSQSKRYNLNFKLNHSEVYSYLKDFIDKRVVLVGDFKGQILLNDDDDDYVNSYIKERNYSYPCLNSTANLLRVIALLDNYIEFDNVIYAILEYLQKSQYNTGLWGITKYSNDNWNLPHVMSTFLSLDALILCKLNCSKIVINNEIIQKCITSVLNILEESIFIDFEFRKLNKGIYGLYSSGMLLLGLVNIIQTNTLKVNELSN